MFPDVFSFNVTLRFLSQNNNEIYISRLTVFDLSGQEIENLFLDTTDHFDPAKLILDASFNTYGYGTDIKIKIPGVKENIGYIKVYNISNDLSDSSRNSLQDNAIFYIIDEFHVPEEISLAFDGDGTGALNVYSITVNKSNFNLLSQIGESQGEYLRTLDPDDVLLPYRLAQNTYNDQVTNDNSLNYLTIQKHGNAIEYMTTTNTDSGTVIQTHLPN